jgi:hypothetical protein
VRSERRDWLPITHLLAELRVFFPGHNQNSQRNNQLGLRKIAEGWTYEAFEGSPARCLIRFDLILCFVDVVSRMGLQP